MESSRRGFLQALFTTSVAGSIVALSPKSIAQAVTKENGLWVYRFPLAFHRMPIVNQAKVIQSSFDATSAFIVERIDHLIWHYHPFLENPYRHEQAIPPIHMNCGDTLSLPFHLQIEGKTVLSHGEVLLYVRTNKPNVMQRSWAKKGQALPLSASTTNSSTLAG